MRAPTPPRLRVLFLSRLFSGLKSGLAAGRWEPRGVPTIYRLLEGVGRAPAVELMTVFTDKEADGRFAHVVRQDIAPIGDTLILPWRGLPSRFPRLELAVTEAEHTVRILALARQFKPDVVYATYANIHVASLLARAGHKVVLRLMGIVPHHREIAAGGAPLFGWEMRAPFAAVVSTEEGSDPAVVLPKLLAKGTPWTVRVNGCDLVAPSEAERAEARRAVGGARPIVVFLARLEPEKGCLEFVTAVLALLRRMPGCADVVIVGEGPLRARMQAMVMEAGASASVKFTGSQTHAEVGRWLAAADIYVSVNLFGNISNANLEALSAGACVVLPSSDAKLPLDASTDRLIPADAALRYDRGRIPDSLTDALAALLRDPQEIARRRDAAKALRGTLVKSWDEVIAADIAQLKAIAAGHADPNALAMRSA